MYDVAIIGGGIIGLATGLALRERFPRLELAVLEKERRLAAHQTGHNSGVIHAGLYYPTGSLKARLCVEGRDRLYQFCARHGVPHRRCGKLVVAHDDAERVRLRAVRGDETIHDRAERRLAARIVALPVHRGEPQHHRGAEPLLPRHGHPARGDPGGDRNRPDVERARHDERPEPGEQQHRRRAGIGSGQSRAGVVDADAGNHHRRPRTPGGAGVPVGHVRRGLLVAGGDEADATLAVQPVEGVHDLDAGQPEHRRAVDEPEGDDQAEGDLGAERQRQTPSSKLRRDPSWSPELPFCGAEC